MSGRARKVQYVEKKVPAFSAGSLMNLAAIPILSAGFYFVGNYFLTGDTLKRHDEQIKSIQVEAKANVDAEVKAREEARKVFLDNQLKTTEILGKLDTRLAVSETKQEVANQTLSSIKDELSRIGSVAPRR